MGRERVTHAEREAQRAMHRDLVWAVLWGMPEGAWVSSRAVYDEWRGSRSEQGIAYDDDYIGPPQRFTYLLNRLCEDERAEVSRAPGRHPRYRAIVS